MATQSNTTLARRIVPFTANFLTYQVYHEAVNGTWAPVASDYIRVAETSVGKYKTVIVIHRNRLSLLNKKPIAVNLILSGNITNPDEILCDGHICFPNSGQLKLDVTEKFKNSETDFSIALETVSPTKLDALFYPNTDIWGPALEIVYLTNENTRPTRRSIDLGRGIRADLDMLTGEVEMEFDDVPEDQSALGIGIGHRYKAGSRTFCGIDFKLNLDQTLIKNHDATLDADYIFTDERGNKHGFKENFFIRRRTKNFLYRIKTRFASIRKVHSLMQGTQLRENCEVVPDGKP